MSFREWKFIKLGEIGTIITGKTPSTKNEDNFGNKYPFITPRDMDGQKRIVDFTERYLSQQGLESVSKQVLDGISICVSCIGSDMGKVILARTKCVTNQQINSITSIKEDYDPFFIYYSLKPLKEYFHKIAGGSTMPIINKSKFSQIEILVPPLKEQKAIAHILSTLDEKIELNKKINKTLEDIAQAIFKHWFVDFEFPNENGEPYKSSGGEMVESELGMIPKGWEVIELGNLVEIVDNRGKTPPQENQKTNYPIIDVKALSGDSRIIDYNKCIKYVSRETYNSWFRSGHPKEGDILLSTVGSLAEMKIFSGNIGCIAQNVVALRCIGTSNLYLYQYLKHIKSDLVSYNIGSVQPSIKITHIIKHKILKPDMKIENQFHSLIKNLTELIINNCFQNNSIVLLRDTLLPKLMSGEIRVPRDQEEESEEVS